MYKFIKNPFTISILMGILFAVAFSSGLFIFNNISFAQKATTPSSTDNSFDSSTIPTSNTTNTTTAITTASNGPQNQPAASNKIVQFNHYENNEIGISLKYPSNFLIDESNSNNTLRQISFYPTNSAPISSIPEQYILWMDVFVQNHGNQQQHPLLSLSQRLSSPLSSSSQVSNPDLASYSINLANSIQQANKDVSIIGSYPNVTLSGYPAYKLITKSFIGNTAIIDVLISAAVNNTIYSVDFQTNSSNYSNSISDTNKIIQSFKIMSPASLASATTTTMNPSSLPQQPQPPLSSSSPLSSLSQSSAPPASTSPNSPPPPPPQQSENSKTKPSSSALMPSLSNILSDLQLNDIANNSTHLLKTLKNTVTNSMNDVLSNPQNALDNSIKGTTSLIPTTPSELTSLPSTALKKACGLPFVSGVCSEIGNSVINKNQNQNANIEKSVDNGSSSNTSSSNSISNNAAVKRANEGIVNGTIVGANVNKEAGIGNGESSINNGNVTGNIKLNNNNNNNNNNSSGSIGNNNSISDNNNRNSLIKSLENLFSANTNNNTNQSLLSSNSSALIGSGLSFLEKLIGNITPSAPITNTPNSTSSVPTISSLNSSMLAATTGMANQSNSTIAHPPSSSSSSPAPSSQQQSSSTYIPPPIH
jgi:hypothetical protein